uniref:Uncharacterized protein n=1 Tax=viral metagenome TaxID=1070528 RepID=A0A6C0M2I8_9ZZZZ
MDRSQEFLGTVFVNLDSDRDSGHVGGTPHCARMLQMQKEVFEAV